MKKILTWYKLKIAKNTFLRRSKDITNKGLYVSMDGKLSLTTVDGRFRVYPKGGIHDLNPSEVLQCTV